MKRLCRAGTLVLALEAMCAWPVPAQAGDVVAVGRDVVVVDVDAPSGAIDAARLREAIGEELGADAVAPSDSRAPGARGVVAVSIDRAARTLVVSYREKAAPIVRTIDLPGDPGAILRAAVLLAGNLARDEASELSEMLRKKGQVRQEGAPIAQASEPQDWDVEIAAKKDSDSERDIAQMRLAFASYSRQHEKARAVVGWTAGGAALALYGAGIYVATQHEDTSLVLVGTGTGLAFVWALAFPSPLLDRVERYYERDRATGRPPSMVRDDVEGEWLSTARKERLLRLFLGSLALVGAGVDCALGAQTVLGDPTNRAIGALSFGMGSGLLAAAILSLSLPWPTEASLHSYERATGRSVGRDHSAGIEVPTVSLTFGGGGVGMVGRF